MVDFATVATCSKGAARHVTNGHVLWLSCCSSSVIVFPPNFPHAGNVTSPGGSVGVLLNGAVNLTWQFALTADVTALPSILLNGTRYSLETLRTMDEVSVEESVASTSVVLTAVGVEWNGSSWRWVLEEFGGVLLSNETMLFVQGVLVGSSMYDCTCVQYYIVYVQYVCIVYVQYICIVYVQYVCIVYVQYVCIVYVQYVCIVYV